MWWPGSGEDSLVSRPDPTVGEDEAGVQRPAVSVVMPFAGGPAAAIAAVDALGALARLPGDELILADNSGTAPPTPDVHVVRAAGEQSPAHARNVGAAYATAGWILFLDADCRAPHDLLDAYFADPVGEDVGALAGEVVAAPDGESLAARYGAARSFLSQQAHLEHPFRPRAVAANLLVRRAAFEQVGGFYEGVRAAEDTDFSWRLQEAGWRLELRPEAFVVHRYRTSLGELRRQWRGYAAGRAWLARRYHGFTPEPAVRRAFRRAAGRRAARRPRAAAPARSTGGAGRLERGRYLAIDSLLALEELAGLALSNRPAREGAVRERPAVVLVADRFPTRGDPLVDLARTLGPQARVEAAGRPEQVDAEVARALAIDYREDDGVAARAVALLALVARHPWRCTLDLVGRRGSEAPLAALAPAVRRLIAEPATRVLALGAGESRQVAARLARLAGRPLEEAPAEASRRGRADGGGVRPRRH
jgi:GT2 family glycosyltransferase